MYNPGTFWILEYFSLTNDVPVRLRLMTGVGSCHTRNFSLNLSCRSFLQMLLHSFSIDWTNLWLGEWLLGLCSCRWRPDRWPRLFRNYQGCTNDWAWSRWTGLSLKRFLRGCWWGRTFCWVWCMMRKGRLAKWLCRSRCLGIIMGDTSIL